MDKDFSPEKRLLKIIEGQQGKAQGPSPLDVGKKLFSPAALKSRFSFFKSKAKTIFKPGGISFDLKFINASLQIGMILLGIYLGMSIKMEYDRLKKNPFNLGRESQADAQADTVELGALLKPKEFYLEKTRARNLFKLADVKQEKQVDFKEEKEKAKKVSKLAELTQGFKLVGISWSESPDAIIEDTKTQKTFFVKTGQMINDIKIEAIYRDKVVLHCEAEEVELR